MTQSGNVVGAQPSVWTVGRLSADELERLAGEIRPSWEVGLDAANDGPAVVAAILPSASGFAAAPSMLAADLGSMSSGTQSASVNVAIATAVPQASVSPRSAPPPPRVVGSVAPPANAFAAQPMPATARPWDDADASASKPKGLLFGGIAAGVAAAGLIAFLVLRGGGAPTPTTATPPESIQAPIAPEATPSAAAAPAIAPRVTAPPPPAAPPVLVAMAAEPQAAAPSSHHGHHAAPPPPPAPHVAVRQVAAHSTAAAPPPAHHHSTASHGTHRMRGAGFVTDSPY